MTETLIPTPDRELDLDERAWWDFWNRSHRATDNVGEVASELFSRTAAVINQLAAQQITRNQACRMLEIGCGGGSLSRMLTYSSYHGLDISPAAIEIAREQAKAQSTAPHAGASHPTYEAADFHDWPSSHESFDVAVCVDAVAYFRDQPFAVKKMAQSLRPNGILVMTTINPFVYHRIKRTQATPLREGAVSRWLSRNELHSLIKGAGFTIERSFSLMPRGHRGILRLINAHRINHAFGPRGAALTRRLKEQVGLGQYRLVVARKTISD